MGAFNVRIVEELQSRLGRLRRQDASDAPMPSIRTLHGFGAQACYATWNSRLDDNKVAGIAKSVCAQAKAERHVAWSMGGYISRMVRLAKEHGFGIGCIDERDFDSWRHLSSYYDLRDRDNPSAPYEESLELCVRVLRESADDTSTMDYADMLYLPLRHDIPLPQYDFVLLDEIQDLNWTRRQIGLKLIKPNGRLIGVGDENQAIYGYSGADPDSMNLLVDDLMKLGTVTVLPLSMSYRCSEKVGALARQLVPSLETRPGAPEGTVTSRQYEWMLKPENLPKAGDAILCRNNAPLMKLAFQLIRAGVGCRMAGRDISTNLIKLASSWKCPNITALSQTLSKYLACETRYLTEEGRTLQAEHLTDQVETLRAVIDRCRDLNYSRIDQLVGLIKMIFQDRDGVGLVVLSSIHAAKGLEWEKVWFLGPELLPSWHARLPWQRRQEKNLCYVGITRAIKDLVFVALPKKKLSSYRKDAPDFESRSPWSLPNDFEEELFSPEKNASDFDFESRPWDISPEETDETPF